MEKDKFQEERRKEEVYLAKTLAFMQRELQLEAGELADKKEKLIAARREMRENTGFLPKDFTRAAEMNQYLSEVNNQTMYYQHALKRVDKYRTMLAAPYFGRFDFLEEGAGVVEKIYLGLANVMDQETNFVYVYDWRAPISGMYYRYETGKAEFEAPLGLIKGEILLKRQYKIQDSQLKYFFDSSVRITDDILQEVLSRSASAKMRTIVETIQKEQDAVIRDTDSELLIVQGVAGSGKTSIALHRVAFLLYHGLGTNTNSNHFMIISPNLVFSKYISSVLPELGEENVRQMTFDEIITENLAKSRAVETRVEQLEMLVNNQSRAEGPVRRASIDFKGSKTFLQILDRLLWYYAHRLIPFEDISYNGIVLETKQQLKNRFLNNKIGIPMAKQLQRLEKMILEKVHPLQKERRAKLEKIVENHPEHELEVKSFSRYLAMKETRSLMKRLYNFTRVDYYSLYQTLFTQPGLFFKLAQGLELPQNVEEIIARTKENLAKDGLKYEDYAPLIYLKLKIEGTDSYADIRHVVIDEAQDYYPLHYAIFRLLFRNAGYTVLGDVRQAIGKDAGESLHDDVVEVLGKQRTRRFQLNRSYRSSYEINVFAGKILGIKEEVIPFERHEKEPEIVCRADYENIDQAIIRDIPGYLEQGYESVAVICKTKQEAESLFGRIKDLIEVNLVSSTDGVNKGAMIIPSYLAKGLEFDVVIVYGAGLDNYAGDLDRKLLYIACTRALHYLALYYTGEKSPFI